MATPLQCSCLESPQNEPPRTVGFGVRSCLGADELGRLVVPVRRGRVRAGSPRDMCASCSAD